MTATGQTDLGVTPGHSARTRPEGINGSGDPLCLEQISKTYTGSDQAAVRGVDLRIASGEFFSLLGPSGSGKTTTLRMIAGFERPSEGRILLGDEDITDRPPHKRPVHTVFQNYALFPHMNVRQNVAYPLRMAGVAKSEINSRVDEFLERVGVSGFAKRMPHQLSGGQRQRVALARALVPQPQLVLLDEPLGALDLKLRQEMQVMLQHLQRDVGITFVYVTHDQGEALAMSDHIAIMADGEVHQVGTPQEVYTKPQTTFVARFVGSTNLLECESRGGVAHAGGLQLKLTEAAPDGRFHLSVRPEAVRLGPDAEACDNRLQGLVEEVIYQGSNNQLQIRANGYRVKALASVGLISAGEEVAIGWDAENAVLIKDDDAPVELMGEVEPS